MKKIRKEYLMAATTIFFWATLPPLTKLILQDFPSMTLLCYSSVVVSVALLIILRARGHGKNLRLYSRKDVFPLLGLGFLGEFIYSALYYQGLILISATDACILNYLWPIAAVVFACIFLKECINARKMIAVLLSFFGIVLVVSKGSAFTMFSSANLTGSAICILAALCYGLFNVLNKLYGKDQWINMTFYFILTSLLSGITSYTNGQIILPTLPQWAGIIWLGLCIDAIGIVIWAVALQNSEVSFLVNFAYATPVLAMLFSAILLNESINMYSCAGLILILSSFFLQK